MRVGQMHRLAYGVLALAALTLIPSVPRAQTEEVQATANWCATIPPGAGHPPINFTPVAVQVLQRSVEPVQATDGLIHLVYAAQATNTQAQPIDIGSVVPVDALAGFTPTGRNLITDAEGRDVAGTLQLFGASPDDIAPDDPEAETMPNFSSRLPAGGSGLMFFNVTYPDATLIPRLLAHAITLVSADGGPSPPMLTNPVPVGCRRLAVLSPPLVGQGWTAFSGCCAVAGYHRDQVPPINGILQAGQQFAIDFEEIGPNNTCCNGPPQVASSWWGYNTPVLAAAPGVVVQVVDGMPDQSPVGTVTNVPLANLGGNRVVEEIGGGQYVLYAHLKPQSIPTWIRKGVRLRAGELIGHVGNSGNSSAPHLHFQVTDAPEGLDATGLPFVFESQLLEGSVPEGAEPLLDSGAVVPIDPTGSGPRRNQMPARNGVFGYNLSH